MDRTGVFILILFLRFSQGKIQAIPQCQTVIVQYTHVTTFDNRMFSRWLLWSKSSVNRNECAIFCLQEKTCVSFQVNSEGSVCRAYAVAFNENSASESAPGYMLFVKEKGFIGSSCQHSTDCSLGNSVCVNSECMCDPGLAFSPQQKSCVSTCTEYGPHYTTIRGYYIGDNNMATYTGVTEQQCMDRCTTHTAFVCRSADRRASDGRCDLSTQTLLTVAASYYRIVSDPTSMVQFSRDCKA